MSHFGYGRMHNYPVGTKTQHRTGYIKVKIEADKGELKWEAESRRNWQLKYGELEPGDRVFHIDGDRTNNHVSNLAMVHFNQTKFVLLKESKVLFIPKQIVRPSAVKHVRGFSERRIMNRSWPKNRERRQAQMAA